MGLAELSKPAANTALTQPASALTRTQSVLPDASAARGDNSTRSWASGAKMKRATKKQRSQEPNIDIWCLTPFLPQQTRTHAPLWRESLLRRVADESASESLRLHRIAILCPQYNRF